MKYVVEVLETLKRKVDIDADSKDQAISKVKNMYYNGDIFLDDADIQDGGIGFLIVEET